MTVYTLTVFANDTGAKTQIINANEMNANFNHVLAATIPIGSIIPFYDFNAALSFNTDYWAYCDGSTATVGSLGVQTLPDLSNRYLVGFGTEGGGDIEVARQETRKVRNANARRRYAQTFWVQKARSNGKLRRPLTLAMIESEQNAATKAAMIKVYGLDKFLCDVKAEVIETQESYSLIQYPLDRRLWVKALKMTCPSTGTVYIHAVRSEVTTVSKALDWIFQTDGYLERLLLEA